MKKYINKSTQFVWAFMLSVMVVSIPDSASAFDFGGELCKIIDCFFGSTVVGMLGTVAVIFLGIGAFFGKVNWGLVVTVAVGIILLAGAGQIATVIGGDPCDGSSQC